MASCSVRYSVESKWLEKVLLKLNRSSFILKYSWVWKSRDSWFQVKNLFFKRNLDNFSSCGGKYIFQLFEPILVGPIADPDKNGILDLENISTIQCPGFLNLLNFAPNSLIQELFDTFDLSHPWLCTWSCDHCYTLIEYNNIFDKDSIWVRWCFGYLNHLPTILLEFLNIVLPLIEC